MNITRDNVAVGLFVHVGTMLGNLYVQAITEFNDYGVHTEYLQPAPSKAYNTSYYWDSEYSNPGQLVIIPDPVRFVWQTPEQARYIMEHDRFGLGQATYNHCWSSVAVDIVWKLKHSETWKETIDGKRWQIQDYYVPGSDLRLREARGWRKSDHMFNGDVYWAVMGGDPSMHNEWTDLRTCLRRVGLWFDDSKYLQGE